MTSTPPPSRDLLQKVKAHFISEGTTLAEWCRRHGYHQSNVREALAGAWDGPKGRALRMQLAKEAGILRKAA